MDLEKLKNRDYVLVIDRSGSMQTPDTPNGKSRWDYAKESSVAIARRVSELDPDGIKVIPFGGSFKVYDNSSPDKVEQIFKENDPMGGTILAPVLHNIFTDYITRKKAGNAKVNGEIVLVVTDGCPEDEDAVAREIVKFGNQLDPATADIEYGISFLQVGKDAHASAYLKRLDDGLVKEGAKNDIVNTKTMEDLETVGLTEALIAALED